MELVFDSRALCRNPERAACTDLPSTLMYRDAREQERRVPVALRTRGRYRADTVQCELPALFVFFTGETRDTLFAGESMLPLTTHCARSIGYPVGPSYFQRPRQCACTAFGYSGRPRLPL